MINILKVSYNTANLFRIIRVMGASSGSDCGPDREDGGDPLQPQPLPSGVVQPQVWYIGFLCNGSCMFVCQYGFNMPPKTVLFFKSFEIGVIKTKIK